MRLTTWARPARMSSKAATIRRELALAADQGRGQPRRLEAAGGARAPSRAQQPEGRQRLALALQRDLLARREAKACWVS